MSIETEWSGTPSWWNYAGRLLIAILLVAASGALQITEWEYRGVAGAALIAITLILFLSVCWSKFSNRYRISGGTVSATYGILSQETHEIDVRDIRDIVLRQSLAGRILNYGNLEFSSAGRDTAEVVFEGIPDPKKVKDLITRLKRAEPVAKI
ncbi:MAG: PH domain-containing protein [Candidatus Binatia bacterium]